ncbi:MAG TPA: hypothetical protein VKT78_11530 [Fimbriimonadaceae bacterium]|nr:hypothetical protein [Fimbriimonadaceae bacterium]
MRRTLLVFVTGLVLVGCGSGSGPSIAGTWEGKYKGATITLTANSDTSFKLRGTSDMDGRWESSGSEVRLYRNISKGGDMPFGDGGDGAIHFKLSKDGKQLEGKGADGSVFAFTKK